MPGLCEVMGAAGRSPAWMMQPSKTQRVLLQGEAHLLDEDDERVAQAALVLYLALHVVFVIFDLQCKHGDEHTARSQRQTQQQQAAWTMHGAPSKGSGLLRGCTALRCRCRSRVGGSQTCHGAAA